MQIECRIPIQIHICIHSWAGKLKYESLWVCGASTLCILWQTKCLTNFVETFCWLKANICALLIIIIYPLYARCAFPVSISVRNFKLSKRSDHSVSSLKDFLFTTDVGNSVVLTNFFSRHSRTRNHQIWLFNFSFNHHSSFWKLFAMRPSIVHRFTAEKGTPSFFVDNYKSDLYLPRAPQFIFTKPKQSLNEKRKSWVFLEIKFVSVHF